VRWALYKKGGFQKAGLPVLYMCIVSGDLDTHAVLMEPSDDGPIVALSRSTWELGDFERVWVGSHPNDEAMLAALRERGFA
jgi:hypothetical protein